MTYITPRVLGAREAQSKTSAPAPREKKNSQPGDDWEYFFGRLSGGTGEPPAWLTLW
jgi:hypothetical protein